MGALKDLTNEHFGYWEVLEYVGNKKWKCRCTCGKERILRKYDLTHLKGNKCPHTDKFKTENLVNRQFGEWEVLEYIGKGTWLCKCSCGKVSEVKGTQLLNGTSKSCGHSTTGLIDLTNKRFGEWKVLKYLGNSLWRCECSCGEIRDIHSQDLRENKSKSCGHDKNKLIDLTNKRFGNWLVKEYIVNKGWLCECQCEKHTTRIIDSYDLRVGNTKSCGCLADKIRFETKYGESAYQKIDEPREKWQIDTLNNKDKLLEYISDKKVTPMELSQELGVTVSTLLKKIHKYELEEYIDIYKFSELEKEIYEFIASITDKEIIRKDRNILQGKELDIYIPDLNIAIEINGNYWHSDSQKDKLYHQRKTIDCIRNKIRLIHIFEYEWRNNKEKIKRYLENTLSNTDRVYARNTEIREITSEESREFEEKNHLQGYSSSSIRIGLFYSNGLIGEMTFGKPRFNRNYQYELIRLCFKHGIKIIGGSEKMFKYFIDEYNPESIISYCNLAKFDGNVYFKLEFNTNREMLTEPNYVWVEPNRNEVLARYKTQKHRLLKEGLGEETQTEDEIMKNLNYLKIYDSGNMKFIWEKEECK